MLELKGVSKCYRQAGRDLRVLQDIHLHIARGSTCAIVGPSGSGKTTLLSLCAGLDRPSSGRVVLDGNPLDRLSEDALAVFRRTRTGFVFQSFRLLPSLTALENVMLPAELNGATNARARARELLDRVGLNDRADHYPVQLSGGEQQRVALARAYINHPLIIFADEPTGNLDATTGEAVLNMLFDLNHSAGTTLVLVTHDQELTRRVAQIVRIQGGQLL